MCITADSLVKHPTSEIADMGYWPDYRAISPEQRYEYLQWLSLGKKDYFTSRDIGYLFLYFYGLEVRALEDHKDIELITKEVCRLLKIFGDKSGSVRRYLCSFVIFVSAQQNYGFKYLSDIIEYIHNYDTISPINILLNTYISQDKSIPTNEIFQVMYLYPNTPSSRIIENNLALFKTLYEQRYTKTYPMGFLPKAGKTTTSIDYTPARPLPYGNSRLYQCKIPAPIRTTSQFQPLCDLWNNCIEDLRSFNARQKGQDITSNAYWVLPDEVKAVIRHPDADKWDNLYSKSIEIMDSEYCITAVKELMNLCRIETNKNLTQAQKQIIINTAHDNHIILLPDISMNGRQLSDADYLIMLRDTTKQNLSENYQAAAILLELGMGIAAADGDIAKDEISYINDVLNQQFILSPYELSCLKKLQKLFETHYPSAEKTVKLLKNKLSTEQFEEIAKYSIRIAVIGSINEDELKVIRKTTHIMGLSDNIVNNYLNEQPFLVTVRKKKKIQSGEIIPQRTQEKIHIDQEALKNTEVETQKVKEILNSILSSDDANMDDAADSAPDEQEKNVKTVDKIQDIYSNIDERYRPALTEIMHRDEWTIKELTSLLKQYGFMLNGFVDYVNAWADEELGDYILIDDGNSYIINNSITNGGTKK